MSFPWDSYCLEKAENCLPPDGLSFIVGRGPICKWSVGMAGVSEQRNGRGPIYEAGQGAHGRGRRIGATADCTWRFPEEIRSIPKWNLNKTWMCIA